MIDEEEDEELVRQEMELRCALHLDDLRTYQTPLKSRQLREASVPTHFTPTLTHSPCGSPAALCESLVK